MGWEFVTLPATGSKILADLVDTDRYVEGIKLVDPTDASTSPWVVATGGTYNGLPVSPIDGGGDAITPGLFAKIASGTITGDTSPYTSLDAYHSGSIAFQQLVTANGGTGHILGATCHSDHVDTSLLLRLWLFSDTVTGTTLNTQLDVSDADNDKSVGYIDFSTWANGKSSMTSSGILSPGGTIPFQCGGSVDDLYGLLQVLSTPTFGTSTDLSIDLMVQAT